MTLEIKRRPLTKQQLRVYQVVYVPPYSFHGAVAGSRGSEVWDYTAPQIYFNRGLTDRWFGGIFPTMPIIKDPIEHARRMEERFEILLVDRITAEWRERGYIWHGRTLSEQVIKRLLGKSFLSVPAFVLAARLKTRGWIQPQSGYGLWYFSDEFVAHLEKETGVSGSGGGVQNGGEVRGE